MKYKINAETGMIYVYKTLTTPEISEILNKLLRYEREKEIKYINWKFQYVEEEVSVGIVE